MYHWVKGEFDRSWRVHACWSRFFDLAQMYSATHIATAQCAIGLNNFAGCNGYGMYLEETGEIS